MTKCALCHDTVNEDHPGLEGGVVDVNPQTNRRATMHGWCLRQAVEDLPEEERSRYFERCQG